ncbi:tyrosine-type recombinase/integrase [Thauera mechernichensis]
MGFTVKQAEKLIREGKPGAFADGDGLYLKVGATGSASWQYRYQIDGKRRMMGLGSCSAVGLAEARDKAADARKLVKQGIDPLAAKEAEQTAAKAMSTTFRALAAEYIADHRAGWRNAKHAQQWENTLAQYAHPKIGDKPIAEIDTEDVLGVLKPIWTAKPETASRLRNRIELVIDAGRAKGLSAAPNPAAWRGHLDKLLPKRTKASKGHHAAMDYRDLPAFYRRLTDERDSTSATALQITILTACRTSEVLLAAWGEFDLDARLLTIPGERMKAGRPHRVPLSEEVLKLLQGIKGEGYVFPGARTGRPLSNMAMTQVLRRLGHPDLTVHGFRSTFRDWCAEETHYPNIVAEQALAHTVGSAVEAAYRRGDLLDKRRALMADWATYCTSKPASNVVPIRSITAA